MGTWSHEPFGNDVSNDWAYDLEETRDYGLVRDTLLAAAKAGAYLDADTGQQAVAAAEVVAKALGRGSQSDAYTEKVEVWLKGLGTQPPADSIPLACSALEGGVGGGSERRELRAEGKA